MYTYPYQTPRCVAPSRGLSCLHIPGLSGHSKEKPKIVSQDLLFLNAGQKYCRMLQESILQYFRPSLSYHLSSSSLFCLFNWLQDF